MTIIDVDLEQACGRVDGGAPRRRAAARFGLVALATAALLVVGIALAGDPAPASAAGDPAPRQVDTWAWCGVHPDDPAAARAARAMAISAGIDATFGPCKNGPPGYTASEPGDRYAAPEVYMRLVAINADAGMKTVVYDRRVWSDDPVVRAAAKDYWRPVYEHIAAWDMGDEFEPSSAEWQTLIHRTEVVLADVAIDSYVQPFSNQLASATEDALADLPGSTRMLSFDQYFGDQGVSVAASLASRVDVLMCAVNAYRHFTYRPSPATIHDDTRRLVAAGCDMILVFGGAQVYGSTLFGPSSIIDQTGAPTDWATAVQESSGHSNYVPVDPARLLETRVGAGLATVDGIANGIGVRAPGTVTELQVGGRANIAVNATSAVLTVTAIGAATPGFVSVYPCGTARPNVAQLNHDASSNVATTVTVKLSPVGKICVYNLAQTDVVVDAAGYFPPGTTFTAVQPARLLETRADVGLSTVDGAFLGVGERDAGSVTQLPVAGRAGVPVDAGSASLSVTVTNARAAGYVTVFACEQPQPATATVNFDANAVVTNAVVSGLSASGWVCVFTSADIDLVVDVNGFTPSGASFVALAPQRVLDTRAAMTKPKPAASALAPVVREVQVTDIAGVPVGTPSVIINLTVTGSTRPGFVTVYPCGGARPNASNINFGAGATVSNMVVAQVGLRGKICLSGSADPDYVVDVTSYHP